jgi:DNA-binding response OmpR family regulator
MTHASVTLTIDPLLSGLASSMDIHGRYRIRPADGELDGAELAIVTPDLDTISSLRSRAPDLAILVVASAAGYVVDDAIACLEAGADDYSPASPAEVTARARALLRRRSPRDPVEDLSPTKHAG